MSESGHSQPGLYGQGRRRRRRRGERDVGPPGQNLSGPSRDREYQPRERRVVEPLIRVISTDGSLKCHSLSFVCVGWERGSTRSTHPEDPHHSGEASWGKSKVT